MKLVLEDWDVLQAACPQAHQLALQHAISLDAGHPSVHNWKRFAAGQLRHSRARGTKSEVPAVRPSAAELEAARELVRQARAQGAALTGPSGLLEALTKTVTETALDEEVSNSVMTSMRPRGATGATRVTASGPRPC